MSRRKPLAPVTYGIVNLIDHRGQDFYQVQSDRNGVRRLITETYDLNLALTKLGQLKSTYA